MVMDYHHYDIRHIPVLWQDEGWSSWEGHQVDPLETSCWELHVQGGDGCLGELLKRQNVIQFSSVESNNSKENFHESQVNIEC
jgi:hypothetical protein